jgi:tetratricopeptide (TPR) repeat protein
MATSLTSSEESQLLQTIEMFEVITQSQPQDYQSLEILKEAYSKLEREDDFISASKRIASAYTLQGQLSSAILEYESILQRRPDDAEVLAALGEIESKAINLTTPHGGETVASRELEPTDASVTSAPSQWAELDDGRDEIHRVFVESCSITAADFEACWERPDFDAPVATVWEPFVQRLADKSLMTIEAALKLIADRSRFPYLPLERYDVDLDLTRTFPAEACRRWCVLPFDRMSKTVLVATTNPFNRAAAAEIEQATRQRILWYLASPVEITKALRKAFR